MSALSASDEIDPVIGIDLGTTFSCVACWDDKLGRVEVIPNSIGARTTPSFVAFTSQGRVVGQPAKDQAAMNPSNTLYDVKRVIGRGWDDEVVEKEAKSFPFKLVNGGDMRPMIQVQWRGESRELSPEEVSAMVLTEMKRSAELALGRTVTKAVITVPAHFNDQQRKATKDAGRIAGLDVLRIINEPTAAALAYGLQDKVGAGGAAAAGGADAVAAEVAAAAAEAAVAKQVLIFDLGGGTFDVSVLSMDNGVFEVKATGGDTHLGGEDFDSALVAWAVEQISVSHSPEQGKSILKNGRSNRRLRTACEAAKRLLSTTNNAMIEIDNLIEDVDVSIKLTREIFDNLNAPLFKRCIDTVHSVLKDAGVPMADVSDCVLVGGSTRLLALQEQLRALFVAAGSNVDLCKTINPDEAVAVGAAVQGRILATGGLGGGTDLVPGSCRDLLLLDVTPLSLGIELEGRVMSTLIKRNTAIPCRKTRTYSTVADFQTDIDVVIYEGERPCVDANNKLGSFVISGVERAKAGVPQVEVTFALDANGILNVSAQDTVTNAKATAEIKADRGRLSDNEIDRMINEAEQYRSADDELATKVSLRNSCEEALYKAIGIAKESSNAVNLKELNELRDWLELDSDDATLEALKERAILLNDRHGAMILF